MATEALMGTQNRMPKPTSLNLNLTETRDNNEMNPSRAVLAGSHSLCYFAIAMFSVGDPNVSQRGECRKLARNFAELVPTLVAKTRCQVVFSSTIRASLD